MNITLLGHEDIASLYALDTLIRALPEHNFTVFWSGVLKSASATPEPLQQLARIDRQLFEGYLAQSGTATEFRQARALPAPNSEQGLKMLRETSPDLCVSIRYRRIIRDAAIAVPKVGVLNLHSGVLPDYRGVMATFWAMLHNEAEIGATLHRIVDAGIDTGPVLGIARQAADYKRSYLHNVLALYAAGCQLIVEEIRAVGRGKRAAGVSQRTDLGRYFSTPDAGDLAKFARNGKVLADGSELAAIIS